MCAQLVVYPLHRPIFSTTLLGWLPVPYYTQQWALERILGLQVLRLFFLAMVAFHKNSCTFVLQV